MKFIKLRFEVLMIKIARHILKGRNVSRSKYVSRRDNNDMWYMSERLERIEKSMLSEYNNQ